MNPRGNVLVVHVVSARNLHIRTQKALDVYISLAISGNGPWKSKVTTNTLRLDADNNARGELHTWDEHCEFQLNDMDTKLVAHVNHKTLLGTTETLGELVLSLDAMARFQQPVWFALAKPGNGNGGERGQIQLGYQFTSSSPNSATTSLVSAKSVSSMSLNKIEKEKKFDRIRRKMQQQFSRRSSTTKRASVVDDAQSLASVSIAGGAINYNSGSRSSLSSTTNSAALAFSSPTPSEQHQQNGIPISSSSSNTKAVDGHHHHVHHRHQDDTFSVHSSATNDFDSRQQQQQHSNNSFRTVLPHQLQQQQHHPPTAESVLITPTARDADARRNSVGARSTVSSSAASSTVNNAPQRQMTTIAVGDGAVEPPVPTTTHHQQRNLRTKVRQKAEQLLLLRGSGASSASKKPLEQPQVTIDDFDAHGAGVGSTNRNSSRRGSMESSSGFASLCSGQLGILNENTSPEYLLNVITHLRRELLKKEERIRDLEQYTDKLVNKVIVSNPELLQASPKPTLRR
ncbi:hypothetical protein GPALN_004104 [Globodera pallida]|nr:hypothetical protein GPALN_004104 [Globodera pallida]